MDGVERVMVLGILAVIVAILSFAWSATDESAAPVGALGRDVVNSGPAIPLSSSSSAAGLVKLDEAARNRITERLRTRDAALDARIKQRWELMNQNQPPGQAGTAGAVASRAEESLTTSAESSRANGRPTQGTSPAIQIPLKPTAANNGSEGGSDEPNFRLYELVDNDTLWSIAYRSVGAGDTKRMVAHIQQLNPGLDPNNLPIGRTIKLPKDVPARLQNMTPTERAQDTGGRLYIVGEGDSLGAIAHYELGDGSRWTEIYQLNKTIIPDPERIRPGQRLILPDN